MTKHTLETCQFTISTSSETLCTVTGIVDALRVVDALESFRGVGVTYNAGSYLDARLFAPWARRITSLLSDKK